MDIPDAPMMSDIDQAAMQLQDQVMDELAEFGWDNVTCARVLMNLSQRLDRMADRVIHEMPKVDLT